MSTQHNTLRIDKSRMRQILIDAGVIDADDDVEVSIVWENNDMEPLFEPVHGANGLHVSWSKHK